MGMASLKKSCTKPIVKKILLAVASGVTFLLVLEAITRLCGRPHGDFDAFFPNPQDLYPRNQTLKMTWGPIAYTVKTNNQGFRGDDFSSQKPSGSFRILTIGDSITDGFFVDNASMWQPAVQAKLAGQLRVPVEVINGARGGGSIDMELSRLRQFTPRLQPDLVILTFVTNDIYEILDVPRNVLLERSRAPQALSATQSILRFFVVHTGLGEFSLDTYLCLRSRSYRNRPKPRDTEYDDSRYAIAGGEYYQENVAVFLQNFGGANWDGLVLGNSFSEQTEAAFRNYCALLEEFAMVCKANKARFLLVYYPAYSQIYDVAAPRYINNRLASACQELGIKFFDMTDGWRGRAAHRVLHLAPVDFHMNPVGNRVFADLLADYLLQNPEPFLNTPRSPAASGGQASHDPPATRP